MSELYYVGGINTIRGYSLSSIAPDHPGPHVQPTGLSGRPSSWSAATRSSSLNLELEFPIVPKVGIKGVVFLDAGNSFGANSSFFEDQNTHFRWDCSGPPASGFAGSLLSVRYDSSGASLSPHGQSISPVLFEFTIGNSF